MGVEPDLTNRMSIDKRNKISLGIIIHAPKMRFWVRIFVCETWKWGGHFMLTNENVLPLSC